MNLNELQSVQSRERQTDSLQQLRDSFYQEVGQFIRQLKAERQEAAAAAEDPFDSDEVQRLTDEIKTAEETVEAIYERRIGKLVKQASLEAAGMAADAEGMTAEERDAFEDLVETIELNRDHVLGAVVGEDRDAAGGPTTPPGATDGSAGSDRPDRPSDLPPDVPPDLHEDPEREAGTGEEAGGGVDAADAMGRDAASDADAGAGPDADPESDAAGGDDSDPGGPSDGDPDASATAGTAAAEPAEPDDANDRTEHSEPATEPATSPSDEPSPADHRPVDRATVRITADVGEILGVDERSYDLATEDVVTLPEANAGPLVDKGAAERLD